MTQNLDPRSDLIAIVHEIRRRWRMKVLLRGAVLAVAAFALALLLSAWGLQWMRFTPQSIGAFRVGLGLVTIVLVYVLLVRPQMRRVTDEQVALYLEEHEPSLEAAIISAVEAERDGLSAESPVLVRKLLESAVEKCRAVDAGRRVERHPMRRYSGGLAAVVTAAALIFLLGPAYMQHALSALLLISRSVEAAAPYRIEVTPGAKTIPRGADQPIAARLIGFQSDQASLMTRKSSTAAYERVPLIRQADGTYDATLFDVAAAVQYFVEAAGVRSPVYTLNVANMPYVQRLELEYHFPAYTGLAPRKIEDGGDVAVLKGTEVWVRAVPTMTASGGGVVLDDKDQVPLAVGTDGSLTGKFIADHNGFYRIDLDAPNGPRVNGSPKYSIDVLEDHPPTVSFTKPGRDTSASPIEEVLLEAKADDDYGVKALDLVYSINGGPQKAVKLFDGRSLPTVSATHTLYLEEMNVQPGDSLSYFAEVTDNDAIAGGQKARSDIHFIRVRPLEKDFRKADSQAGAGGGGQKDQVGALSQQEREIIAATFNLQRDRKTMAADKFTQGSVVVGLMQKRLVDQVNEMLGNFATRVQGAQAEQFKKIVDFLKQSVPDMATAAGKLQAAAVDAALPPENKALEALQKAEEEYQLQVAAQQGGGGGGGAGQDRMAQELADLFALEVDKMANQYETSQQASQQQADQKIDALAEKLKELARRQEQEAERQRQRASAQQGGGGADQRALADQAEEAARQLQKLARDENKPQLADAARKLQQAADAMRQAAANGDPNAASQAANAADALREAQRQLQQTQGARSGRDAEDALRQARELQRQQQQIQDDVSKLDGSDAGNRADKVKQLSDRKNTLAGQVDQLEHQLDRSAGSMFKDDKDASRKMTDAANTIRDRRIRDKIRFSDSLLRAGGQTSDVASYDRDIQNNLDDVTKKLSDAAAAVGHSKADPATQALDKAQQLSQGMQSLGERMRQSQQARNGQQGQNPQSAQKGQTGQNGQNGQKSPNGQQGQSQQGQQPQGGQQPGQQGQGQPGQGQQGQGQQGQGQQGQGRQGQGQQGQAQGQQAQNGQQQGQGGGGRNDGAATLGGRNGEGNTRGGNGFNPESGPRTGQGFDPEQVRQFRNDARQRAQDAEQLRKLLQQQKIDTRDLEQILKQLHQLDDANAYKDPQALAKLESSMTDNVKRFEYTLRRRLGGDGNQVFLSGTDEVPDQYRKQVEQYYRSLSSKAGGGK